MLLQQCKQSSLWLLGLIVEYRILQTKILDLGVGTGRATGLLIEYLQRIEGQQQSDRSKEDRRAGTPLGKIEIDGVDSSPGMLAVAATKLKEYMAGSDIDNDGNGIGTSFSQQANSNDAQKDNSTCQIEVKMKVFDMLSGGTGTAISRRPLASSNGACPTSRPRGPFRRS